MGLISGLLVCFILPLFFVNNVNAFNDPLGNWVNGPNLPKAIANQVSFSLDNNIYILGGSTNVGFNSVYRSSNDINGNLNLWVEINNLSKQRYYFDYGKYLNSIYLIGGSQYIDNNQVNIDTVSRGLFQNNDISNWNDLSSFPIKVFNHASTVINGKLYVVGGYSGGAVKNVYFANLENTNSGNITWTPTLSLPEATYDHKLVSHNGFLYVIGGRDGNGEYDTIYRGEINTDGSINSWNLENEHMPTPNRRFGAEVVGDYLFVIGGQYGSILSNSIYFTKFNSDGTLQRWQTSDSHLPEGVCCGSSAVLNGFVYHIGGWSQLLSNYSHFVYVSKLFPTPEITPEPPVTPIPTKRPIILIPGITACWNYEALIHGAAKENKEWGLGEYAWPYANILHALERADFKVNKELAIYCYDWRKPVSQNISGLDRLVNELLEKNNGTDKVNLIGHSMGGIIGAEYTRQHDQRVDKLVTAGTPFKGSAMSYKVWEGADLSDYEGFQKIAMSLFLEVNRKKFPNQVTEIRNTVPSLQDLLPIYDYIKTDIFQLITWSSMMQRNQYLNSLNLSEVSGQINTLSGIGQNTPETYIANPRDVKDAESGRWEDGKPSVTEYGSGDGVVLAKSSQINGANNSVLLAGTDHGGIISSPTAQEEIFKLLGITATAVGDTVPKYRKSLVVTIASPVSISVKDPTGTVYEPKDGLVLIDNPMTGNYSITMTGIGTGDYTLFIGRFNEKKYIWENLYGEVTGPGQTTIYRVYVNLESVNLGSDLIKNALRELDNLYKLIDKRRNNTPQKQVLKSQIQTLRNLLAKLNPPNTNQAIYETRKKEFTGKIDEYVLYWQSNDLSWKNEYISGLNKVAEYIQTEYTNRWPEI